jgi:hypothetical protein
MHLLFSNADDRNELKRLPLKIGCVIAAELDDRRIKPNGRSAVHHGLFTGLFTDYTQVAE